jgi:hypothetical protein
MSKVARSNTLQQIVNSGYSIQNRIQSLEKSIDNALTLDHKIELVDKLQDEAKKLNDLNMMLSSQPNEPYLNYFKAQMSAWLADQQVKWGYVSGFK